jgi:methionyl-tRNA formyltransferase
MLAGQNEWTPIIYNALTKELEVDAVILEDRVPRGVFLRTRIENLDLFTVIGQQLFKLTVVRFLQYVSKARIEEIKLRFRLDDSPIPPKYIIYVDSVNSEAARSHLMQLNPKVVVIFGTRIISKDTLKCIPAIFVNMHTGITPLYRGHAGGYWALAREDPRNCGVSVHLVDEGIDTGPLLGQSLISPTSADNFITYSFLQIGVGIPLLIDVINQALNGQLKTRDFPEGPSKLWSHPTLWSYVKNLIFHNVK